MKKIRKIACVVLALFALCLVCASFTSCRKKSEKKVAVAGVLSYLGFSEDQFGSYYEGRRGIIDILEEQGYVHVNDKENVLSKLANRPKIRYYDSLDSLLMALKSGEIEMIMGLPQTTAIYLHSKDEMLGSAFYYDFKKPRERDSFAEGAFARLCDGFSFMFMENNEELCYQFSNAIEEMQSDGIMEKLIDEQIISAMYGQELTVAAPEQKEGRETIKVAVTGDLPPMDYIAADGTFAGFNTALLAEIGKRLDKNIKLVQVTSVGRATALASGTVDVVFWTRSNAVSQNSKMSSEEFFAWRDERRARGTDAESEAMKALTAAIGGDKDSDIRDIMRQRDMPEGTIITIPYFEDMTVSVVRKY